MRKALGHKPHDKKDPATRTFQAIRIHINRELGELSDGLAAAERVLKPGGRLAVVTFHIARGSAGQALLPRAQRVDAGGVAASAAGRRDGASEFRECRPRGARGRGGDRGESSRAVGNIAGGAADVGGALGGRSVMVVVNRFRWFGWFVLCVGVILGCYLMSSQVAAERNRLADVERAIASTQRDIRALETEFDTRANLAQLQRWNGDTLKLSAPTAAQYVRDDAQLALARRGRVRSRPPPR